MSASRIRAQLRKGRRELNRASLTPENKLQSENAVRAFILFGGKRGKRTPVPFEVFAKRFPLAADKQQPPPKNHRVKAIFLNVKAALAVKIARRREIKRRRKQRHTA